MISIEKTQEKIVEIVERYKREYPQEYEMVCQYIKDNRKRLKDEFASLGEDHALKRMSREIPETLSIRLVRELDDQETVWFTTIKAARWFVKQYPEFMSGETA